MDIKIKSNFRFTVAAIEYTPGGELYITLESDSGDRVKQYEYTASLGDGAAVSKPVVSLLEYARGYYAASGVKEKTRDCYRLMCRHLEAYGDKAMDEVTTEYLQGFVSHLQGHGLQVGTVRLYFQKLTCVLHEAYRDGLFDDRVLQRVRLPRRERRKRSFLTEAELGRLSRTPLGGDSGNIQDMFMFSCLTGLRFGDVERLSWRDVRHIGRETVLEYRQQKTGVCERLPLCPAAEEILKGRKRRDGLVFTRETNQRANAVIKRWCRAARIKKTVTYHTSRHTFCVLLLTKGVPIYTVQRLMGHSDIATTNIYADLLNRTKAKAVCKLPAIPGRTAM